MEQNTPSETMKGDEEADLLPELEVIGDEEISLARMSGQGLTNATVDNNSADSTNTDPLVESKREIVEAGSSGLKEQGHSSSFGIPRQNEFEVLDQKQNEAVSQRVKVATGDENKENIGDAVTIGAVKIEEITDKARAAPKTGDGVTSPKKVEEIESSLEYLDQSLEEMEFEYFQLRQRVLSASTESSHQSSASPNDGGVKDASVAPKPAEDISSPKPNCSRTILEDTLSAPEQGDNAANENAEHSINHALAEGTRRDDEPISDVTSNNVVAWVLVAIIGVLLLYIMSLSRAFYDFKNHAETSDTKILQMAEELKKIVETTATTQQALGGKFDDLKYSMNDIKSKLQEQNEIPKEIPRHKSRGPEQDEETEDFQWKPVVDDFRKKVENGLRFLKQKTEDKLKEFQTFVETEKEPTKKKLRENFQYIQQEAKNKIEAMKSYFFANEDQPKWRSKLQEMQRKVGEKFQAFHQQAEEKLNNLKSFFHAH